MRWFLRLMLVLFGKAEREEKTADVTVTEHLFLADGVVYPIIHQSKNRGVSWFLWEDESGMHYGRASRREGESYLVRFFICGPQELK